MGDSDVYPIIEQSTRRGKDWVHNPCGTFLQGKEVTHSIHDGPGLLSGGGRVHTEVVPYCPTCGPEPSANGAPIRQDPVDVSEAAILRRMSGQGF